MQVAILWVAHDAHDTRVQVDDARVVHIALSRDELQEHLPEHTAIGANLGKHRHLLVIVAPHAIGEILLLCLDLEHLIEEETDALLDDGSALVRLDVLVDLTFAGFERIGKLAHVGIPRFAHLLFTLYIVSWNGCLGKRLGL